LDLDAFGAGNIGSISKIEGSNWRHGDIEDTLLALATLGGKKFSKMDVKRVCKQIDGQKGNSIHVVDTWSLPLIELALSTHQFLSQTMANPFAHYF
jgi:hypothetical protein